MADIEYAPQITLPHMTPEQTAKADQLIAELQEMAASDPFKGTADAQAFLGDDTRDRTVDIGRELYGMGGEVMLIHACNRVQAEHGWIYRHLEAAWDDVEFDD